MAIFQYLESRIRLCYPEVLQSPNQANKAISNHPNLLSRNNLHADWKLLQTWEALASREIYSEPGSSCISNGLPQRRRSGTQSIVHLVINEA